MQINLYTPTAVKEYKDVRGLKHHDDGSIEFIHLKGDGLTERIITSLPYLIILDR